MAWYDDHNKTLFTGTYANEKQLQWDMEAAGRKGWVVQTDRAQDAVIGEEGGAPAAIADLPRGPKGQIQVTFVRAEDWLENRKLEIATVLQSEGARAADAKEARFVKAAAELENAEAAFYATVEAAATCADSAREPTERQLLSDLKTLIARRQATLKAMDEAIREMNNAVAVGAAEFARSIASHMKAQVTGQAKLEAEQRLVQSQELVARAAREWRDAGDKRRSAEEELRKRTVEYEAKDTALYGRLEARNAGLDELRNIGK